MSEETVTLRVICLGQTKKLAMKLDAKTGEVIAEACEKFHLDPNVTDRSTLQIYVPMPKSLWLDPKKSLRDQEIASSDTLMIQTKAASDNALLQSELSKLSEQKPHFEATLAAASQYAACLQAAYDAEALMHKSLGECIALARQAKGGAGHLPRPNRLEKAAVALPPRRNVGAAIQSKFVDPWSSRIDRDAKEQGRYQKHVNKVVSDQEKQKAAALKAAAKMQNTSIDAMMAAVAKANESIIGFEAERAAMLAKAQDNCALRHRDFLKDIGDCLFAPVQRQFVESHRALANAIKDAESLDQSEAKDSAKEAEKKKQDDDVKSPRKKAPGPPKGAKAPEPPKGKDDKKDAAPSASAPSPAAPMSKKEAKAAKKAATLKKKEAEAAAKETAAKEKAEAKAEAKKKEEDDKAAAKKKKEEEAAKKKEDKKEDKKDDKKDDKKVVKKDSTSKKDAKDAPKEAPKEAAPKKDDNKDAAPPKKEEKTDAAPKKDDKKDAAPKKEEKKEAPKKEEKKEAPKKDDKKEAPKKEEKKEEKKEAAKKDDKKEAAPKKEAKETKAKETPKETPKDTPKETPKGAKKEDKKTPAAGSTTPGSPKPQQLQLVPLKLDMALKSCSTTAADAHAAGSKAGDELRVALAPMAITVGADDTAVVLGRGGLTGITDKQLSRSQAQLVRRSVDKGSTEDLTGAGVALDITQMGTNNTYMLPADEGTPKARFDERARARRVLGAAGADCHEKIVVLRKGVAYSLRVGDIIWLLKDKYPYEVTA